MAAQHLAAMKIQRHLRILLNYLRKHPDKRKDNKRGKFIDDDASQQDHHFTTSQKLRSKFLTSAYNILHKSEEGCFQNF
jgi:hypothetical protein